MVQRTRGRGRTYTVQFSVPITPEMRQQIKERAERLDITDAELCRRLIQVGLSRSSG